MKYTCCRPRKLNHQQGSAIVLALFVLVVLALLATSLMRLLADSHRTSAVDVYGTRAYLAAQAGVEQALVTLFPAGQGGGVGSCLNFPLLNNFNGIAGLVNCSNRVDCASASAPDSQIYYQLTSTATCSAGAATSEERIQVSRRIQAQAKGVSL